MLPSLVPAAAEGFGSTRPLLEPIGTVAQNDLLDLGIDGNISIGAARAPSKPWYTHASNFTTIGTTAVSLSPFDLGGAPRRR